MTQRFLPQVRIDQRRHDADLREAEPDARILEPRLHQQRNRVALAETFRVKVGRHPVGQLLHLGERKLPIVHQERYLVRLAGDHTLEDLHDCGAGPLVPVQAEVKLQENYCRAGKEIRFKEIFFK